MLEVDVAKVLPKPGCPQVKETLILPKRITSIRYQRGSIDKAEPTTPCAYTVVWDDPPVPTTESDDPINNRNSSVLVAPSTEPYAQYCAARTLNSGGNIGWNDACVVYYVEKNDGNSTWNYYSSHVKSSCGANGYGNGVLTSCGRGVEMTSPGQWVDFAPSDGITYDCRTISNSVTLLHFDVGYNYTSCDEQRAYKYTEPGKMSTYWKGEQSQSGTNNNQILGGTSHHVSVKVPQADGRPSWSHWWNSDAYYCGGLGLPFCL
ncbi:hypothetical protein AB0O34_34545 [Sphaerisporangium sp. NPDC088356]|uniref:hypothetical protein n=1 Tax=Sphaerisporangium sp. NPDC088356 TaxID=3154871 RepID=UPI00343F60A4